MEIVRWPDAAAFLERARPFLLADEARHTLSLGSALMLAATPAAAHRASMPPLFATVEDGAEIHATAMLYPPYSLVISPSAAVAAAERWPWLGSLVENVRKTHPTPLGVQAPPELARAFAAVWAGDAGASGRLAVSLRIHQLVTVRPLPPVPGALRRGTTADRDLVVAWMEAMHDEALPDDPPIDAERLERVRLAADGDPWLALYLWERQDGTPVSVCGASGPTPGAVRVNAVYTPPEHRRHGYATAAVAELSRLIVADGRRAVLFTDLGNPTSNRIYAQIGYEPVCDVVEWRFG